MIFYLIIYAVVSIGASLLFGAVARKMGGQS